MVRKNKIVVHFWFVLLLAAIAASNNNAQSGGPSLNADRLGADFEPEIKRAMEDGKIPSCTVALMAGDRVVWQQAYGYSNV